MLNAILIFLIASLALYVGFQFALLGKARAMRRKERKLQKNGVTPYGSGLCHGVVLDKDNKRKVVHDEKPSESWYSRLA